MIPPKMDAEVVLTASLHQDLGLANTKAINSGSGGIGKNIASATENPASARSARGLSAQPKNQA
jgi:hypothetical protein